VKKITKIDTEIINLLMEDGRMTASEIAQRIGFTERSVRYRIERLIEHGVIKVTAVVDPRTLGYAVVADVWIEVESGETQSVAERLLAMEFVTYLATSIGEIDISVQIVGRSNEEIYTIVTEQIGKTKGVRKTTTAIVPIVMRDVHEWHIPSQYITNQSTENEPQSEN
jgi:Lrp/AsnC family transcriptional regulator for asnA, asnC and gidA